jgi:glycosyltransferase involved in cell wall biosynthesis
MVAPELGLLTGNAHGSMTSDPVLSIVIPAFNEELRIGASLGKVIPFLESRNEPFEILVIDDGSTDATVQVVEAFCNPQLRVIRNPTNRGKGYSVRRGLLEAKGSWVLFTDADLSTPIEELDTLMGAAVPGVDVVIGSRAIDRSKILVHQSRARELAGILFNRIVRLILRLPIADTQCGFKLFRRGTSLDIFQLQTIPGFGFDPEVLYLARRNGLGIREVPVTWRNDEASKVRLIRDATTMFLNLIEIRWNWVRGRYRSRG